MRCYLALGLGCVLFFVPACDALRLESTVGHHVVVHWNPRANSLCGGTVLYIDSSLEHVANTYGVPLPEQPSIDIFWTDAISDSCGEARACAFLHANGTSILFVDIIIDDHELTHAVRLSGSHDQMPSFFHEGVAERWNVGPSDDSVGKEYYVGDLSHGLVRNLLNQQKIAPEHYDEAAFFWAWLEATFGPKALVAFSSRIRHSSNIAHIETIFEDVFGLSLAEATEASRGQPLFMSDVHACSMSHVPELIFEGAPLVISDKAAECGDSDIVNTGAGAGRVVHINLPDVLSEYSLEISGPASASVRLDRCLGALRPYEKPLHPSTTGNPTSIWLSGDYAFTISAAIELDGTVELPSVRLSSP